jgi:hypothetical protein
VFHFGCPIFLDHAYFSINDMCKGHKDIIIIIIIKLSCPVHDGIPGSRNIIQITSFLTLALNRSGELQDPAALPLGMTRYPLDRRPVGPQSRYGGL